MQVYGKNGNHSVSHWTPPSCKKTTPAPTTTTTAAPLPWDIFSLLPSPGPASVTRRRVVAAPGQQKVIEPVLKNQYLTKLQRTLLPPPSHLVSDFEAENIV